MLDPRALEAHPVPEDCQGREACLETLVAMEWQGRRGRLVWMECQAGTGRWG